MQFSRLSRIALAISATCLSAGAWAETNQVYSETVSGHNAPMTVDVIMKDGAIKNILVDDRESPGAGKKAIAILKKQILENQTVNLDAVTGATITSSSFVSAVSANLKKSGVDLKKFSKGIPAKELNDKYESQVVIIGVRVLPQRPRPLKPAAMSSSLKNSAFWVAVPLSPAAATTPLIRHVRIVRALKTASTSISKTRCEADTKKTIRNSPVILLSKHPQS